MQDNDGITHKLKATIDGGTDRLYFHVPSAKIVLDALMKGGTVKFRLTGNKTPSTKYSFNIRRADAFAKAYTKLMK